MNRILILFTLFILFGCAATNPLTSNSMKIERGFTKEQVVSILDMPLDKQFHGKDEAWQYCSTGFSTDSFLIVWFYDERVTGMQTYKNNVGVGMCTSFFKTIRWEDAPDRSIEFRLR